MELTICLTCSLIFERTPRQTRKVFCSNKCKQKHFYDSFKVKTGVRYKVLHKAKPKPRYKVGCRCKLTGGVLRKNGFYIAHISVDNKPRQKSYSTKRLGEKGAKLAATFQRMAWVIELGVWNPRDGDPFEILSYAGSFEGNQDYQNAKVDDVSSPWIIERE